MLKMTPEQQLDLWCEGHSVHNAATDECCPDFSCCNQKIDTPIEDRKLFRDRPELRDAMLGQFLHRAILTMPNGDKIYVAGVTEGEG